VCDGWDVVCHSVVISPFYKQLALLACIAPAAGESICCKFRMASLPVCCYLLLLTLLDQGL
jgi:hypothetical protein